MTGPGPVTYSLHSQDVSFSSARCMLGLAPALNNGFSGLTEKMNEQKGLSKLKKC